MRRPTRPKSPLSALAALACLAALAGGCGKSSPSGVPAEAQRTGSADPARAPSVSTSPPTVSTSPPAATATVSVPQAPPSTGTTSAQATQPTHTQQQTQPSGVAPAHPVPAAFQPSPGAPSDEEVREELARMSAVERETYTRTLSAAAANLAGLLPWSLEPKSGVQESVASVFTDYGLGLACGGVLGRHQLGVAHKTAPCGTLITFSYGGRSITVPVIDRGPYVAGREWDLTGATAEALRFPGLGRIAWSLAG